MSKSRLERFAPLTGIAFIVLLMVGSQQTGGFEFRPPVDDIVALFKDWANLRNGAYLANLGAFFLIWFAGSVRSTLRAHEDGSGQLSAVSFGGGLASAITIFFAFAILSTGTARGGAEGDIAATLYDLADKMVGHVLPVTMAVFVGAAGLSSLRTAVFPAWFGWASVVAALASLSPVGGYFLQASLLVWVVVVSIWLTVRGES